MMMGLLGLSSSVSLLTMYDDMLESRRACGFVIRSMLTGQPN